MVKAHQFLKNHLGIEKKKLLIGGNIGRYQALEWTISEQSSIENLFLMKINFIRLNLSENHSK